MGSLGKLVASKSPVHYQRLAAFHLSLSSVSFRTDDTLAGIIAGLYFKVENESENGHE